jgi:hypothetical protein
MVRPRWSLLTVAAIVATLPLGLSAVAAPSSPNNLSSGGTAVAYRAGGAIVSGAPQTPTAELYDTGSLTIEPTLGITRDGTLFVDTVDEAFAPHVIRSTDQAQTWTDVSPGHVTTSDPYLYVDPIAERVFNNDYQLACHAFSFSDDLGDTWTTKPIATCTETDHENVFAGPAPRGGAKPRGYPNVVYSCGNSGGIGVIFFSHVLNLCNKSLDGGRRFLPTGLPPYFDNPLAGPGDGEIPGNCNADVGHGYVGPDGTVFLPKGWCGQPWVAMSHNEGLTWRRVQVADNGVMGGPENAAPIDPLPGLHRSTFVWEHEGAVAADADGNVYYAWVARDRHMYLAVSRDGGRHWGSPLDVTFPGLTQAALPALDIGTSGKVAVAYVGSSDAPGSPFPDDRDCLVGALLCHNHPEAYEDATWNGYLTMTADALDPNPLFYGQSVNDPAQPLVKGGPCGPVRCLQEYDFIDVRVGPTGVPWAVFVDACGLTAKCRDTGEAVVGRLVGGPSLCEGTEPTMSACPA